MVVGWLMVLIACGMSVATVVIRHRGRHDPSYQDGTCAAVLSGLLAAMALIGGLITLDALSFLPVIVVGATLVTVILPYAWRRSRRSLYPDDHEE